MLKYSFLPINNKKYTTSNNIQSHFRFVLPNNLTENNIDYDDIVTYLQDILQPLMKKISSRFFIAHNNQRVCVDFEIQNKIQLTLYDTNDNTNDNGNSDVNHDNTNNNDNTTTDDTTTNNTNTTQIVKYQNSTQNQQTPNIITVIECGLLPSGYLTNVQQNGLNNRTPLKSWYGDPISIIKVQSQMYMNASFVITTKPEDIDHDNVAKNCTVRAYAGIKTYTPDDQLRNICRYGNLVCGDTTGEYAAVVVSMNTMNTEGSEDNFFKPTYETFMQMVQNDIVVTGDWSHVATFTNPNNFTDTQPFTQSQSLIQTDVFPHLEMVYRGFSSDSSHGMVTPSSAILYNVLPQYITFSPWKRSVTLTTVNRDETNTHGNVFISSSISSGDELPEHLTNNNNACNINQKYPEGALFQDFLQLPTSHISSDYVACLVNVEITYRTTDMHHPAVCDQRQVFRNGTCVATSDEMVTHGNYTVCRDMTAVINTNGVCMCPNGQPQRNGTCSQNHDTLECDGRNEIKVELSTGDYKCITLEDIHEEEVPPADDDDREIPITRRNDVIYDKQEASNMIYAVIIILSVIFIVIASLAIYRYFVKNKNKKIIKYDD